MKKSIGWVLLLSACALWIAVIAIPFLSLSLGVKAALVTTCIIVAEILFWLGAILVGKNLWQMLRDKKNMKKN